MKKFLIGLLACLGLGNAIAGPTVFVQLNEYARVVLWDEPKHCKLPLLYFEYQERNTPTARNVKGCYHQEDGLIYLLDEEGDQGIIPKSEFKKLSNA